MVGGYNPRDARRIGDAVQKIERLNTSFELPRTHTQHQRVCRVKLNDDLTPGGETGTAPPVTGNIMLPKSDGTDWIDTGQKIGPIEEPDSSAIGAVAGDQIWVASLAGRWYPISSSSERVLFRYTGFPAETGTGTGTGSGTGGDMQVAGPISSGNIATVGLCRRLRHVEYPVDDVDDEENEDVIVFFTEMRPRAMVYPGDTLWASRRGSHWYAENGGVTSFITVTTVDLGGEVDPPGYVGDPPIYPNLTCDDVIPAGSTVLITVDKDPLHPSLPSGVCAILLCNPGCSGT